MHLGGPLATPMPTRPLVVTVAPVWRITALAA